MYKLSRERVSQLARLITDGLHAQSSNRFLKDQEIVRQAILHALVDEVKHDEEHRSNVREKILGMKRPPAPSSKEWDQLFRKLLDEEYEKEVFDEK